MKKMKKQFRMGTGISSILMIFVMLCLTIFGVLSFVTANADNRLTQKNQTAVQAFYKADAKAADTLAGLDALFQTAERCSLLNKDQPADLSAYRLTTEQRDSIQNTLSKTQDRRIRYDKLIDILLQNDTTFTCTREDRMLTVSFTVSVDDNRTLYVDILATPFETTRYQITRYQTTADADLAEQEETLDVWQGVPS